MRVCRLPGQCLRFIQSELKWFMLWFQCNMELVQNSVLGLLDSGQQLLAGSHVVVGGG